MSIMNQKDVKNNVHRSGFDLSRRVCFTAKVGELLPINWMPVLPGDKIDIDLNSFGRTAPLQTATFGRIREYYDCFFVPYRLLWKEFPQWVIQTKQPVTAKDLFNPVVLSDSHPYILASNLSTYIFNVTQLPNPANAKDDGGLDAALTSQKLLSYLGYKVTNESVRYNPFPVLAYQKLYQDFFRFSQWESTAPWTYNLDYMTGSSLAIDLASTVPTPGSAGSTSFKLAKDMVRMQYCNFDRDMFNGILPNAQYGDEALVDVFVPDGSLSYGDIAPDDTTFDLHQRLTSTGDGVYVTARSGSSGGTGYLGYGLNSGTDPKTLRTDLDGVLMTNAEIDFSSFSAAFSILSLRKAEARQKWKEITQSGDLDYTSQIFKHWNESVPDTLSYKCKYIGGTARNLDVSEVINNNLAAEDSVADIAGKGISSNDGHFHFDNKSNDYGILMVVYHAKPLLDWEIDHVVNKELLKTTVDSYAIPEFDNLGNEKVMSYESMYGIGGVSLNRTDVAGYAPRYYEYKTSFDVALGEFQYSLKPWLISYKRSPLNVTGSTLFKFNYLDFKVFPSIVDNLFGVKADSTTATDQFYNSCYMDVKAVRNLSRDGLPY